MSSSIKDTLIKTDAKFFAIHASPSEKELQVMGSTGQEKAETMKRYIRKVLILEYAKNFNKKLFDSDIKFYGEIYFCHSSIDNELNMHCHLIVSRKDQTNKKKLSPLTNHKNSKNGIIKGGFDRVNLIKQVEQRFDKLFGYERQLTESFEYNNTMKNGSIAEQLKMQQGQIANTEIQPINQQNVGTAIQSDIQTLQQADNMQININVPDLVLSSLLGLPTPQPNNSNEEQQIPMKRKKKKSKRGFRR